MKITNIRVYKSEYQDSNIKAVASILLDDCFIISGIKIIDGKKGLFVTMPSKKQGDDCYIDIAHPINNNFRDLIQNSILDAYYKL